MAERREIVAVFAAGVAQGTALVAFPAAGTILTSPSAYALSGTQYGALFVPQVACAIGAALAGAELTRRIGIRRIFLLGLAADVVSMALFFASRFALADRALAYAMLLAATASLGVGFGLAVPALNTLAAGMFPHDPDRAVLALNALLGVGTVLAPALVAVFVDAGVWWGLPLSAGILALAVLASSAGLRFADAAAPARSRSSGTLPRRLWLYALAAFLYGVVETMNGNWAELVSSRSLGAPPAVAAFALIAFWASVTAGRLTFGAIERWLPQRRAYRLLPFLGAAALAGVAALPHGKVLDGIVLFGVAGIGCSALLPLTISFAQEEFAALASVVAGTLIACYQLGYGLAAFGVGPLQALVGASLSTIFVGAALAAVALGVLSFVIVQSPTATSGG